MKFEKRQELLRLYLKRQMKAKNKSYKSLAKDLGVAEVTIKKWMTSRDFKIINLMKIGEALDLDFFDIMKSDQTQSADFKRYSPEQDHYFANHFLDFLVFIKMYYQTPLTKLKADLNVTDSQIHRILLRLEKVGVLEVWDNKKVKFRFKGPFLLRPDGHMINILFAQLRDHLFLYFKKKFKPLTLMSDESSSSMFRAFELYLSNQSRHDMVQELMQLIAKYAQICESERQLKVSTSPVSAIIAVDQYDGWLESLKRSL